MTWLIFPLIFLASFVDSIAGGGGLISLTSYVAIGLPPHLALGTNKFSSVVGTGMSSYRFARGGHVHWLSAAISFAGAMGGAALGARLALLVDEKIFTYIMVVAVPCIAVFLLLKKDFGETEKQLPKPKLIAYSLLVGLFIGTYDGFFGPGTGTFLIIAFTLVLGFNTLTACGNAKVVNLASNLGSLFTFILAGSVNYRLGIPCALCSLLGGYVGAGLAMKKGAKIIRPMMIVVIGLLLAKIVWDYLL